MKTENAKLFYLLYIYCMVYINRHTDNALTTTVCKVFTVVLFITNVKKSHALYVHTVLSRGSCEYTVECVYWTEPKATSRQCKNQPNAYNMYTDLEGILSACLQFPQKVLTGH